MKSLLHLGENRLSFHMNEIIKAELNEYIDYLDSLDYPEQDDARWEAMAEEHENIQYGMAVMGA